MLPEVGEEIGDLVSSRSGKDQPGGEKHQHCLEQDRAIPDPGPGPDCVLVPGSRRSRGGWILPTKSPPSAA